VLVWILIPAGLCRRKEQDILMGIRGVGGLAMLAYDVEFDGAAFFANVLRLIRALGGWYSLSKCS
jgi:hypothetical protein